MRDGRDCVRAVWSVSQALGLVLTMILLAACGGGDGGGVGASHTLASSRAVSASTSGTISITVNDVAPSQVSYGASSITYSATIASSNLTPTTAGGAVVSWSINPALPAGLNFSTTDGSISGTPTTPTASASYVVTAQNSGGQSTASLTIEVDAAPLLTLGHQAAVASVGLTATNAFSVDDNGYWILWDYAQGTPIATGNQGCHVNPDGTAPCYPKVALAGSTAVTTALTGLEVLSATDGHTLGSIVTSVAWWKLATDGSYVAGGNTTGLFAWSPSGQLLFSHLGDYSQAVALPTPGSILVGAGPAGQNVIETIAVSSGTATTGPQFNGTFASWFTDGSGQFLATAGSTVLVYSNASAPQGTIASANSTGATVGGAGNWVWVWADSGSLTIYPAAGTNPAPAATYTFNGLAGPYASGMTVALFGGGSNTASVIDLSGTTPTQTNQSSPAFLATVDGDTVPYAAVSASQWIAGGRGAVVDGASLASTARYFGVGQVLGITGGTGYFALVTGLGNILYFNSATLAQEGQIAFAASKVALSSDGSLLVAQGGGPSYGGGYSLEVYSLPAGSPAEYTWPYSLNGAGVGTIPVDIALSGSGNVLGQVLASGRSSLGPDTQQASAPTGGATILSTSTVTGYSNHVPAPMRISPDGTLIAASGAPSPAGLGTPLPGTNLFLNGSLVSAVSGLSVGWLDNSRLVVNNYTRASSTADASYTGCTLYGADATPASGACALPFEVLEFQPVTSDGIYVPTTNQILSVSTGSVNWMSGDPDTWLEKPIAAVAGSNVIFVSGIDLVAQSY